MSTLVIVGNGFDLFHGLKTSYDDFRTFLLNNDEDAFYSIDALLTDYDEDENQDPINLWWDFEERIKNSAT